jgi:SAM-dependent methyltransferase
MREVPASGASGTTPCVACGAAMIRRLEDWLLFCPVCGLWRSLLAPFDPATADGGAVDEGRRVAGLEDLRRQNYQRTLAVLRRLAPLAGRRLLDVGAAYGWFLPTARAAGMIPVGLEPDPAIAAAAAATAGGDFEIRVGSFPADIPVGEQFDVIVFNDVLEHLADLDGALAGCRRMLGPDGLLVVSAPDSAGVLFRTAVALAGRGQKELLHRLWQKDYPSPHLSYFNSGNLARLMQRHGFAARAQRRLRSLRLGGLWSRLHMDRRPSLRSLAQYLALAAALPAIVSCLPSDQVLHCYQMNESALR